MKRIGQKKQFKIFRYPKHGLTLVEMLVSSIFGMLILMSIFIITVLARKNFEMASAFSSIHSDARISIEWITKDVRWGSNVEATRTIAGVNYTTGDKELILKILAIDNTNDILANTYDYVVYALDDTQPTLFKRILDPDATSSRVSETRTLARNIESMLFSSQGTALSNITDLGSVANIEVALTTSRMSSEGHSVQETLNSKIELRNQ